MSRFMRFVLPVALLLLALPVRSDEVAVEADGAKVKVGAGGVSIETDDTTGSATRVEIGKKGEKTRVKNGDGETVTVEGDRTVVTDGEGNRVEVGPDGVKVQAVGGEVAVKSAGTATTVKLKSSAVEGAVECTSGQVCEWSCPAGDCIFSCTGRSTCMATCEGGDCRMTCGDGAICNFECGGGDCAQQASQGATAAFGCAGGDCPQSCGKGARCDLSCSGGDCGRP